jgi:hypothetical protein
VPCQFGPAMRKFPRSVPVVRLPLDAKSSVHMFRACITMNRPLVSGWE